MTPDEEPLGSLRPCAAHDDHRPRVASTDLHHVLPLSWGGPDTPSNIVPLCPTGHRNVHELLRSYLRNGGTPPWSTRRAYHPSERELARRAWKARQEARHAAD